MEQGAEGKCRGVFRKIDRNLGKACGLPGKPRRASMKKDMSGGVGALVALAIVGVVVAVLIK